VGLSIITYSNLQFGPYQLTNLLDLRIVKKVNNHVRMYFSGIIPEEQKDKYVEMTRVQTQIEAKYITESNETIYLFKGIVINIKVKMIRNIYYLEGEAASHTYNMDVKLRSRSFQKKDMPYTDLIKSVISEYSGADFIDTASKGKLIEKFTMQYNETDWDFIKRMASRFNAGLIADSNIAAPKFWFGVPDGVDQGSLEQNFYTVTKKISEFKTSSENYISGISDNDFIYYEIESDKLMNIGDRVNLNGKKLIVCEVNSYIKKSVLKHNYILTPQKGLSQNIIYNDKITGMSVEGKVISVAGDNVKMHLEIDDDQSVSDAWWFPYSSVYTAEGNSGWYCMPELGDHLKVYFPNNKEEDGVAMSSVRKDSEKAEYNKVDNPDVKYFRTKSGKELMFAPNEILISAKDKEIYIRLNEEDGIEIFSKKEIKIISDDNIVMGSKQKVIITAGEEMNITCKKSNIKMDGSTGDVTILGNEVKTN